MKTYKPKWIDNLEREIQIRKAIILNGNINDLYYNSQKDSYHSIINIISSIGNKYYDRIINWDQFSGVSDKEGIKELESSFQKEEDSSSANNDEYDMGNDSYNGTQSLKRSYDKPEDFFPLIYHTFVEESDKNKLFIIDFSQYIFNNSNTLPQDERKWLNILDKILRYSDTDITNIDKKSNSIIFLFNGQNSLPYSLINNNPLITSISIPFPERKDRAFFVKKYLNYFKFDKELNQNNENDNIVIDDFIDSLDGFCIREIKQLVKLSKKYKDKDQNSLNPKKLINLFKYGITSSPWEDLSKEKLKTIQETLKKRVKGQDEAIEKVKDVIVRAFTGLSGIHHSAKKSKPKGILFFVGPTGVGKTELAKSLAEFLFGDEEACLRFDMSEYNHEHSDQRLVGAPPGYVGYERGGQLTNAVKEKPFSIILFDEIEKAHGKILDKFLQIFEDGRLTDGKGETVSFSESIIIFTSNIGTTSEASVNQQIKKKIDMNYDELKNYFIEKVNTHFSAPDSEGGLGRPELLNRIGDNIVVFNYIKNEDIMFEITKAKLKPLYEFIKEKYKMEISFDDEEKSLRALIKKVNKEHGGRGILNVIEPKIIDPLADFIFENSEIFYPGRKIIISQIANKTLFEFELK